jgi:hypothetical protein
MAGGVTIEKKRGTSPEEGGTKARTTAAPLSPGEDYRKISFSFQEDFWKISYYFPEVFRKIAVSSMFLYRK